MIIEPGKTYIRKMRAIGGERDALAHQLRLSRALSTVDLSPPGLPASAIVCIRSFSDPLPGSLRAPRHGPTPSHAWEQAAQAALRRLIEHAAYPARDAVPLNAQAVIFSNQAEMLACLANDWSNGEVIGRWWWQGLLQGKDLAQALIPAWLGSPEYIPAALQHLATKGRVVPFVQALHDSEVQALMQSIIHCFGLHTLQFLQSPSSPLDQEPVQSESRPEATPSVLHPSSTVSVQHPFTSHSAPANSQPTNPSRLPSENQPLQPPKLHHAPWQAWIPEHAVNELSLEGQCLLGLGLMLMRAPAVVRSPAFAHAVQQWRNAAQHTFSSQASPPGTGSASIGSGPRENDLFEQNRPPTHLERPHPDQDNYSQRSHHPTIEDMPEQQDGSPSFGIKTLPPELASGFPESSEPTRLAQAPSQTPSTSPIRAETLQSSPSFGMKTLPPELASGFPESNEPACLAQAPSTSSLRTETQSPVQDHPVPPRESFSFPIVESTEPEPAGSLPTAAPTTELLELFEGCKEAKSLCQDSRCPYCSSLSLPIAIDHEPKRAREFSEDPSILTQGLLSYVSSPSNTEVDQPISESSPSNAEVGQPISESPQVCTGFLRGMERDEGDASSLQGGTLEATLKSFQHNRSLASGLPPCRAEALPSASKTRKNPAHTQSPLKKAEADQPISESSLSNAEVGQPASESPQVCAGFLRGMERDEGDASSLQGGTLEATPKSFQHNRSLASGLPPCRAEALPSASKTSKTRKNPAHTQSPLKKLETQAPTFEDPLILTASHATSPTATWKLPDAVELFETELETKLGGLFYLINLALFLELYGDFTTPLQPGISLSIWDFITLIGQQLLGKDVQDPIWTLLARLTGRSVQESPGQDFEPPTNWRMPAEWLKPFPYTDTWHWRRDQGRLQVQHPAQFLVLDLPLDADDVEKQLKQEMQTFSDLWHADISLDQEFIYNPALSPASHLTPEVERWLSWLMPYVRVRLQGALGLSHIGDVSRVLCEHTARIYLTAMHLTLVFSLATLPIEVRISGLDRNPGWVPAAGRFVAFRFD